MARFKAEVPNDIIKTFEELDGNVEKMLGRMCRAGALVVRRNITANMRQAFKSTRSLEKGLKVSTEYHTPSDDAINVFVGFSGYDEESKSEKYPKGVPIPLKAMAREYGTSKGEAKKPFLRRSFKKKEIEAAMLAEQRKFIKE